MCFSPEASFVASGVLATAGAAIAQKQIPKQERFLASLPIFFAIQQFFEGVVWLYLYEAGPMLAIGIYGFNAFALLFWPIAVPIAMGQVETDPLRKKLIHLTLVAGLIAGAFYLFNTVTQGIGVRLEQQCLQYQVFLPWQIGLLYWAGANGALLLSSNPWWVASGLMVALGAFIAFIAFPFAIASVWCYFAASISLVLVLYYFQKKSRK